jgi:hypothetical protein
MISSGGLFSELPEKTTSASATTANTVNIIPTNASILVDFLIIIFPLLFDSEAYKQHLS